jgi:hypothetical protein
VVLKGNILIGKSELTAAIASGLRGGDNKRSFNAFIGSLMLAYWKQEELAEFSLTGTACPSKPGSTPKEKFPEEYAKAISRTSHIVKNPRSAFDYNRFLCHQILPSCSGQRCSRTPNCRTRKSEVPLRTNFCVATRQSRGRRRKSQNLSPLPTMAVP